MKRNGIILINKPKNLTSHDVVGYLRKITGIKKIGHTGTLDPFSTGLLILLIGKEATTKQKNFIHLDKTYWARIKLGANSNTYDLTGKIEKVKVEKIPKIDEIKKIEKMFIGKLRQVPPLFSAKKIKGRKAYELARKGEKVDLKPQEIEIYSLENLFYQWPILEIRTKVSAGTYIRTLAYDFGQSLGVGGYLEDLIRERIGPFDLKQAVDLKKLKAENWHQYLLKLEI